MNRRQVTAMLAAGGTMAAAGQWITRAPSAVAGGWASLELINPIGLAVVGVPVVVDAQVLAHGVTPSVGYPAGIRLVHEASGDTVTARLAAFSDELAIVRGDFTLETAGAWRMVTADMGPEIELGRVEAVAAREGDVISQLRSDSESADASEVKASGGANEIVTDILDSAFADALLEVAAGTTVTWTNTSSIPHQVVSDDGAFDSSQLLYEGDSFSVAFDDPGEYAYYCGPHPTMTGVVRVGKA